MVDKTGGREVNRNWETVYKQYLCWHSLSKVNHPRPEGVWTLTQTQLDVWRTHTFHTFPCSFNQTVSVVPSTPAKSSLRVWTVSESVAYLWVYLSWIIKKESRVFFSHHPVSFSTLQFVALHRVAYARVFFLFFKPIIFLTNVFSGWKKSGNGRLKLIRLEANKINNNQYYIFQFYN